MNTRNPICLLVLFTTIWLAPSAALAHCDGLDGPVVTAARKALETGNVNLALIWVKKEHEADIKAAFDRTVAVRAMGPQARELADVYFFETLVRIHRAGEGAPYTGLKAAGRDLGPAIPAGDDALAKGSGEALVTLLNERMRAGILARFEHALHASHYSRSDVTAGREYVKAYVEFIHYVEQLYETASGAVADAHADESSSPLHVHE